MASSTIKQRVSRWLKRNEKTQADLAVILGISEAHVSQILSGQRRPSLDVAVHIEELTGVPVRAFVKVA